MFKVWELRMYIQHASCVVAKGSGPQCDFRCTLVLQLYYNPFSDAYPYWTHIMQHVEDSTDSNMVWFHQGQDEHQGRSWV